MAKQIAETTVTIDDVEVFSVPNTQLNDDWLGSRRKMGKKKYEKELQQRDTTIGYIETKGGK